MAVELDGSCEKCGVPFDQATNPYDQKSTPNDGDLGVCIMCGATFVYQEGAPPRAQSDEEFDALSSELKAKLLMVKVAVLVASR